MAQHRPTELTKRYRAILVADVSDEALRAAVALACEVARVRLSDPDVEREMGELERDETLEEHQLRQLSEEILEFVREDTDARRRARKSRRLALQRRQTVTAAGHVMSLPAWLEAHPDAHAAANLPLLLDTALVVFHQAYFGPWLGLGEGDRDLRESLEFHSMQLADRLPPPDRARVRALVLEAAGKDSLADSFRDEALALTRPDSHEYMTLLQSAWAGLIERKRFPQAVLLLDREAQRVPTEHLAEFEELVLATTRSRRVA